MLVLCMLVLLLLMLLRMPVRSRPPSVFFSARLGAEGAFTAHELRETWARGSSS